MSKEIFALLLLITITFSAIHVRDGRIVDDQGGELIFHGLNVVSKVPPYMTTFNQNDMKKFQAMGINGIRLGVMWPGVQPKKGQFNQTYLNLMRKTVQDAAKYGIYTLVEFHQDLFSQKFCADGVPVWAIPNELSKNFPRPLNIKKFQFNQNGFPAQKDCQKHSWSEYYLSDAVAKSFGAIWNNHHGLRDMFIRYWMKVAETFKTSEYVIAYQLMNEPWPGDQYRDPLVMVPGLSEIINMQQAYDIISQKIRQVDPQHSICFQPVTWLNYFRSGFGHPPGGKKHANSSIFCYHFYKPPTFNLKKFMKARMKDIKRLKTGGLLSEFYVIGAQGQKNIQMMDLCDDNLQSWFGWIYEINQNRYTQSQSNFSSLLHQQDGTLKLDLIKGVTRTFATRVAGRTISQKYDTKTKKFNLVYEICNTCGPTIIFVSEQFIYTSGFNINWFPKDGVSVQRDGPYYIKLMPKHLPANAVVNVTITAK